MNLEEIYTSKCKCLNVSGVHIPILDRFNCRDINVNIDPSDNNYKRKLYARLVPFLSREDVVFVVLPKINIQISPVLMTIYGITHKIPYSIYFKTSEDPHLLNPLVEDLESIKWLASKATDTSESYFDKVLSLS